MADPFVGEIRLFPYTYAPIDWLECNGQILDVRQYVALYSIIGNTFGGTGPTTFALPNLQGSAVAGVGQGTGLSNYVWGKSYGATTVTLDPAGMAVHNHKSLLGHAANAGDYTATAGGAVLGQFSEAATPIGPFLTKPNLEPTSNTQMSAYGMSVVGGGQAHSNMQPLLALRFCIATVGDYPPKP